MIRTTYPKQNIFPDVVSFFLIFLFVYTAISKLIDVKSFETTLSLSPYLRSIAPLLAWSIPIIELLISSLLFFPPFRKLGLLLGWILMGLFSLYVGFMITVSKGLPCTCGGVIDKMSWSQHLIFNTGVFIISVFAWKFKQAANKNIIAIIRQSRTPV
jgi:hypothetical protein